MSKKSQRRKENSTAQVTQMLFEFLQGLVGVDLSAVQGQSDETLRQRHDRAVAAYLENEKHSVPEGFENEKLIRAFNRYVVSSFEHVQACCANNLQMVVSSGDRILGTNRGLPVLAFSDGRFAPDDFTWQVHFSFPELQSESQFEGILKANIAQLATVRKILTTLEEHVPGAPGNPYALACLLPPIGYIQDMNGVVLFQGANASADKFAQPGVFDGVVRYPGKVAPCSLEELVERWKNEHVARQNPAGDVWQETLRTLFVTFAFDSMAPTSETVWTGTAQFEGKKIPVVMRMAETGLNVSFDKDAAFAPLVPGDASATNFRVTARASVDCEWIQAPRELLESVKKKCPGMADRVPQLVDMGNGVVAEFGWYRKAA